MKRSLAFLAVVLVATSLLAATDKKSDDKKKSDDEKIFSGLELRNIGPALTSGRLIDIAVDPRDKRIWYVASAGGGVWKTTNAGTTFQPVFDEEGSFSIGCVTIDPNDSLVVWVGSGENNSQRSVSMGDGVYKSTDGGKSWKNVGLGKSEHIGKIVVDPRDSKTVYVAAQGPLWAPGGDRGLYKTTDGGKTWKAVLTVSENTGISDVVFDPSNPDTLYAAAYQRRRHVFTLIDGGPESAIYKSTDAGATWDKVTKGLPKEDMGRIGLAVAPKDPKTVYAVIEAARGTGGFFRSKDGGGNWEKTSKYTPGGPQYYQEIFVDPNNSDRIYSADVWVRVSDDGGKTFRKIDETSKHPDSHFIWVDPDNSDHLLIGCDGGLYESFDRAATWNFKHNLPVTQFYRISADDRRPFYHVYGGTQDNFSLGGPSRTTTAHGITNSDWYITVGGDGFRSIPDPKDENVLYAESQNGGLIRFDKRTGETLDIQPLPGAGMDPLRFNWDSPIIVSPHNSNRIYFAAQYLFRSDDRGNKWTPVSGDLTRHINRNELPVMGRVWGIDAVAKSSSTSFYGNIVSLSESPLKEGLIYVGTDDGLIQVTEDGGASWKKIEKVGGVPEFTYVSTLFASQLDPNTVYAAFDNHKTGDFKPYVYVSHDRGSSWKSISSNLPDRGSAYSVVEDFVDPNLLFAGTEYGLYFTQNGGTNWIKMTGGMPTVSVRDLWIQKRFNDLDVATFGRGFAILDDYSPLRMKKSDLLANDITFFPVKDAPLYVEAQPLGLPGKSFQGDAYFTAPNPPFGAIFTYYMKSEIKTLKKQRAELESSFLKKDGGNEPGKPSKSDIRKESPQYPTWEQIRAEEQEPEPAMEIIVSDQDGNVIRRVSGPVTEGFHRVAWDLRYPAPAPVELTEPEKDPFSTPPMGPLVAPGQYKVQLVKRVGGVESPVGAQQTFNVTPLYLDVMKESDRAQVLDFQRRAAHLQRVAMGAAKANEDALEQIKYIRKALDQVEGGNGELSAKVDAIEKSLREISVALNGDRVIRSHNEPTPPSILDRVNTSVAGLTTTFPPTETHKAALASAEADIVPLLQRMHQVIEVDLVAVHNALNAAGAPWTPGRVPTWNGK